VTSLACALAFGFLLAYLAWRERLALLRPLPPHEELKAEVEAIRSDLDTVMAWAGAKRGQNDG
jgi:hypothetical protein